MGQKQSSYSSIQDRLCYCPICMEDAIDFERFKVIGCGHCFCIPCLESWSKQNLVNCPSCRYEEMRRVSELNDVCSHEGNIFIEKSPDIKNPIQIQDLLHLQMVRRARTIW